MANRYFSQYAYSLEKGKVMLFGRVTFGSSGAPTLDAANSKGIASVTRNSAGKYTIVLQDSYNRYLGMDARFLVSSGLPASPGVSVVSQAVGTSGGGTIVIQCSQAQVPASTVQGTAIQYAAADPASGEELDLVVYLKNSSAT